MIEATGVVAPEQVVVTQATWHIPREKGPLPFVGVRRYSVMCGSNYPRGFITSYGALRSTRTGEVGPGCPTCWRVWKERSA